MPVSRKRKNAGKGKGAQARRKRGAAQRKLARLAAQSGTPMGLDALALMAAHMKPWKPI